MAGGAQRAAGRCGAALLRCAGAGAALPSPAPPRQCPAHPERRACRCTWPASAPSPGWTPSCELGVPCPAACPPLRAGPGRAGSPRHARGRRARRLRTPAPPHLSLAPAHMPGRYRSGTAALKLGVESGNTQMTRWAPCWVYCADAALHASWDEGWGSCAGPARPRRRPDLTCAPSPACPCSAPAARPPRAASALWSSSCCAWPTATCRWACRWQGSCEGPRSPSPAQPSATAVRSARQPSPVGELRGQPSQQPSQPWPVQPGSLAQRAPSCTPDAFLTPRQHCKRVIYQVMTHAPTESGSLVGTQ